MYSDSRIDMSSSTDIFRTIIKNSFLNDKDFIKFLSENSDYVKYLYQNSSASQKDGFRHKINELRKTDDVVDGLGKQLGIKRIKD